MDTTIDEEEEEEFNQGPQLDADIGNRAAANFGSLLQSGQYADVELVAMDGQKIRAHKALLTARSSVFAAMFENNMRESVENQVKITDISFEVLEKLMRFIYGAVQELQLNDLELLVAADKV